MLEQTTFKNDELKKIVKEQYGINITNIENINKGTANIFKIYSNNQSYMLKEFQSKYRENDILKEIKAIKFLDDFSTIPVPKYIQCKDKKYYFKHEGKMVIMQKFIEGVTYDKNEGNYDELMEAGNYLGRIIKSFENFEIEDSINVKDWYSTLEMEKSNQKYNQILMQIPNTTIGKKIEEDIMLKKQILADFQKNIDSNEMLQVSHKISHGDYSSLQFIYNENKKVKAILDFIKVKKLPVVWEIARSYSYIDKEAKGGDINIKNLVDYTAEVSKSINLNRYDLKYLPYIYLIQLARSPFGYEQYFKNVENKEEMLEFAFYRTNLCRNLKMKANEISNELLKIEKKG